MLSLCMIVKNEEAFLERCLNSIKEYVDDMVVVDTGSTDRTKQIAEQCGARVFDFVWCNNFSAARNFAASRALYDWVFAIDADQEIVTFDRKAVNQAMSSNNNIGIISIHNVIGDGGYTFKNANLYNRKTHCYVGRIHEQLAKIDDRYGEKRYIDIPVFANHYGNHQDIRDNSEKLEKYEKMLLDEIKDEPNNPYLYYQLGRNYFLKGALTEKEKNMQNAVEWLEKALSFNTDPNLSYIYETVECYCYSLTNSGQPQKAMELIKEYAPYYNKIPDFRFVTAHVYQENAMFIEAVESYESCIGAPNERNDGVSSFLSCYNIGVILECIGMIQDAKEYYTKCGDYKPAVERLKVLR